MGLHIFPKIFSLKVNVIVRREFELTPISQTSTLVLWEPYPYHHNGLLSLLLVLEISLPEGRSLSVLNEQYETSYLFYVTLSFLCNIICDIHVCVFISDTFRGHNS